MTSTAKSDVLWLQEEGVVRFEPLRVGESDVAAVVATVCRRVTRALVRRGLVSEDGSLVGVEVDEDLQLELSLAQASAELRIATGPRAGLAVQRRRVPREVRGGPRRRKPMQAQLRGFDLEAHVRIERRDRRLLERVSRYLLRPALSMERLELREDGLYEYGLRRPWSDGTVALVLKPMELMEKLSVLVPRPRVHLVRYHGVLAPNHRFRKAIVPPVEEGEAVEGPEGWRPRGGLVPGTGQVLWALLLQRVWAVDVLRFAACGGRRVLIEVVEPGAVEQILAHLQLDTAGPRPAPARGPPDG